jgi:hypothetical protein
MTTSPSKPVEFGAEVRDPVSGFVGVVIARAEYAYRNPQLLVAAKTMQAAADERWIPETRVEPAGNQATGFSGG